MAVAAGFGVLLLVVGRMGGGERGYVRDTSAGVFVFGYLGLLGAFAPLSLAEHDGAQRVTMFILLAVCNDTGGYLFGIVAGRHPMAPRISPKKSWEGLGGSLLFAAVGGMTDAHCFAHTTTVLGNGEVLITGGEDQTGAHRPALDVMALDQTEHEVGSRPDRIDQPCAALRAVP